MSVAILKTQMPREKWANRIAAAWQKQVPSIFEVGTLLEAAKAELNKGDWSGMIKGDLPFQKSTVSSLIKIVKCDHLRDEKVLRVEQLPAHWATLYELALLTPEQFDAGIASGTINPKMQRKDVKQLRGINAPGRCGKCRTRREKVEQDQGRQRSACGKCRKPDRDEICSQLQI